MMSEKRFSVRLRSECDGVVYSFFDGDKPLDVEMIVDLLNEQQATITELEEEIKLLKPTNVEQYEQIVQLQEENEQLRQQLKEKEEDERIQCWLLFDDEKGI